MGRGDVRNLLLAALLTGPGHGYELMQRLEDTSEGRWRPSPGSVYPSLQMLEEQGLVRSAENEGRKVYELTDEGRAQADEQALGGLSRPDGRGGHNRALREALEQLHLAVRQVAAAGTPSHEEQALEILQATRRALYQLLAAE
jgi:DNA-binding PadR family transcriptional regulator